MTVFLRTKKGIEKLTDEEFEALELEEESKDNEAEDPIIVE